MQRTLNELQSLLVESGRENLANEMVRRARDAIALTPEPTDDGRIPVGASKFGGDPDLPAATP